VIHSSSQGQAEEEPMFIPRYWSEASHTEIFPNRRQMTVKRFGWSSESQEDAEVHARQRLEEAVAVLRADGPEGLKDFTRRERVVAYSGSDGLPIREEIVEENEALDFVLTRNSYGAVCMNATGAMFVDVDRTTSRAGCYGCLGFLTGGILGATGVLGMHWFLGLVVGAICLSFLGGMLGRLLHAFDLQGKDPVAWAVRRTEQWCADRQGWLVAVYETPAGARLLPLHESFDAAEERTFEFMRFLRADPLYVRMCELQKCFRARVSPKPWRVGIGDHFPAGGTWPVTNVGKVARREAWVRVYEIESREYASCRIVDTIGRGRSDPDIEAIRRRHDELCQATSSLDLA
jgi:hypothetical protein